jgi:hypothetical protein
MKITIKSHDDLTANQVVELMFRISLANGYHQQNVADAFYEVGKAQIEMEEYFEH